MPGAFKQIIHDTDLDDHESAADPHAGYVREGYTVVVPDHGAAATDEVINVCYGTDATPPAASGTTEGALYVQYGDVAPGMATDPLWDAAGDIPVGTGANTGGRLAPNTTATKKFLSETSSSATWEVVADADVPATHSGSAHHTRSHTLTSGSDHTGTADRVLYIAHNGTITELALGASGTYLKSNGATSAPSFGTPGGGVSDAAFLM